MNARRKSALRLSREEALAKLLAPIRWSGGSSVYARQNEVTERHNTVAAVYPFMTPEEQLQANEWFIREEHDGLWD